MKNKLLIICLLLFTSQVFALEECKGTNVSKWDNYHGTFSPAKGEKYSGEFRNGKEHGHGTHNIRD
tara:strand:+ start:1022 stop:1219 length:198 start_codon:yes stop_codon:yes gene_type:complete